MILITHGHTDHTEWLPNKLDHATTDPVIMAPIESVSLIESFVDSAFRMGRCDPTFKRQFKFVGVKPGESHFYKGNTMISTYDLCHCVPTRGYGLSLFKMKLKPEYKGLRGDESVKIKRTGTPVTEDCLERMLAYVTDTSVRGYDISPELLEYKYVMAECTFIKMEPPDTLADELSVAAHVGHTHWADLRHIVAAHPKTTFVLIHMSMQYKEEELVAFRDSVTKEWKNVIVPI
jgi:ribonuclease Z